MDHLTQRQGDSDPNIVVSTLAANPDLALRIVPGFLQHQSPVWRKAAVRLLRDIGTPESLDMLVRLLREEASPQREEAAVVLAGLIKTRHEELTQRTALLPEREDPKKDLTIWPLDSQFPSKLALPIIEAAINVSTGNSAIDQGIASLRAGRDGQPIQRSIKKWRCLSRDLQISWCWKRICSLQSYIFIIVGFLIWISFTSVVIWSNMNDQMIFFNLSPRKVAKSDWDHLSQIQEAAATITEQFHRRYPPRITGIRRILPWNWRVKRDIPQHESAKFKEISTFKQRATIYRHIYSHKSDYFTGWVQSMPWLTGTAFLDAYTKSHAGIKDSYKRVYVVIEPNTGSTITLIFWYLFDFMLFFFTAYILVSRKYRAAWNNMNRRIIRGVDAVWGVMPYGWMVIIVTAVEIVNYGPPYDQTHIGALFAPVWVGFALGHLSTIAGRYDIPENPHYEIINDALPQKADSGSKL